MAYGTAVLHDSVVFGEGPVGLCRTGLCLEGHGGRGGGPVGFELVLKSPGTLGDRGLLCGVSVFIEVASFLAGDPFHEGNGAPSPLFRAFRLMNAKFFAFFPRTPWSCVLGKGLSYLY